MSELEEKTLKEIIEEVASWSPKPRTSDRQPGEFSVAEYAAEKGLKKDQAHCLLAGFVEDGRLVMRKGRNNGYSCNWYKKASP